jgi:hypothetical protein
MRSNPYGHTTTRVKTAKRAVLLARAAQEEIEAHHRRDLLLFPYQHFPDQHIKFCMHEIDGRRKHL